jgi:hypothetical protein
MSGSVPVTFTTTVATVVTVPVTPTGMLLCIIVGVRRAETSSNHISEGRTGNTTRTTTTARSNLPTAATDVNGGGGGGAPSPGSGGRDQNGPNDDYVAGALKIVPWLTTAAGGTLAAVALLVL